MTAIPANTKDRKDKEEKDNLERERTALIQRKMLFTPRRPPAPWKS